MDSAIKITRETEFYQGYIRLRMSVTNDSPYSVMDVTLDFIYDSDILRIERHEPLSINVKQGKYILGNIYSGNHKSIVVDFDPQICSKGTDIDCDVTFKDYQGKRSTRQMEPKKISVICPILNTESDINIGILKELFEKLPSRDSRIYEVQSSFDVEKLVNLSKEILQKHSVKHVRTMHDIDGKKWEIWYYGKTKVDKHELVIKISITTTANSIELFAVTQTTESLTGLLAEIGRELRDSIESKVSGKGRVVNVSINKSKFDRSNLLDLCNMDGTCDVNIVIDKTEIDRSSLGSPNDSGNNSNLNDSRTGVRCPVCQNIIDSSNKSLLCKKCGSRFCQTCESWFREPRKPGENPLCERCFAAERDEKIRTERERALAQEAIRLKTAEEAEKKRRAEEERRQLEEVEKKRLEVLEKERLRKEEEQRKALETARIKAAEEAEKKRLEEAERVRIEQERKREDEDKKARLNQDKKEQEKSRRREVADGVQAITDARKEMNKIIFNRIDKNKPLAHEEVHKIYELSKPIEKGIRLVWGDLEKNRQEGQEKKENEKYRKEKLEEAEKKKRLFKNKLFFSVFIILSLTGVWLGLPLITDTYTQAIGMSGVSLVGKYSTDAQDIAVSGNYAYLAKGVNGLEIVDISNSESPKLAGSYDTAGSARDVAISDNYAYVANGPNGLEIVDITNPLSPMLAGSYYTAGVVMNVFVSGNYAYLNNAYYTGNSTDPSYDYSHHYEALLIVDISNPASPTLAGTYNITSDGQGINLNPYTGRIVVSGNYAYLLGYLPSANYSNKDLMIVDVSNRAVPTFLGSYDGFTLHSEVEGIAVSGNYAYVANGEHGLVILNINEPSSPTLAGRYDTDGDADGIAASGDYAYVFTWEPTAGIHRLEIVNISNPSLPTLAGTYNTHDSLFDVAVSDNYIYLVKNSPEILGVEIGKGTVLTLYMDK